MNEKNKNTFDRWSILDRKTTIDGWTKGNLNPHSYPTQPMTQSQFPSLLPIAMQVASSTVGMNLVSVQPMGNITDKLINEVKVENRDRKIDSITQDKEYDEMKIQDHPDFNGPVGKLLYLDFIYSTQSKL